MNPLEPIFQPCEEPNWHRVKKEAGGPAIIKPGHKPSLALEVRTRLWACPVVLLVLAMLPSTLIELKGSTDCLGVSGSPLLTCVSWANPGYRYLRDGQFEVIQRLEEPLLRRFSSQRQKLHKIQLIFHCILANSTV